MKLLRAPELFEVFPLHWVLLVSPLPVLQDNQGWVRGSGSPACIPQGCLFFPQLGATSKPLPTASSPSLPAD